MLTAPPSPPPEAPPALPIRCSPSDVLPASPWLPVELNPPAEPTPPAPPNTMLAVVLVVATPTCPPAPPVAETESKLEVPPVLPPPPALAAVPPAPTVTASVEVRSSASNHFSAYPPPPPPPPAATCDEDVAGVPPPDPPPPTTRTRTRWAAVGFVQVPDAVNTWTSGSISWPPALTLLPASTTAIPLRRVVAGLVQVDGRPRQVGLHDAVDRTHDGEGLGRAGAADPGHGHHLPADDDRVVAVVVAPAQRGRAGDVDAGLGGVEGLGGHGALAGVPGVVVVVDPDPVDAGGGAGQLELVALRGDDLGVALQQLVDGERRQPVREVVDDDAVAEVQGQGVEGEVGVGQERGVGQVDPDPGPAGFVDGAGVDQPGRLVGGVGVGGQGQGPGRVVEADRGRAQRAVGLLRGVAGPVVAGDGGPVDQGGVVLGGLEGQQQVPGVVDLQRHLLRLHGGPGPVGQVAAAPRFVQEPGVGVGGLGEQVEEVFLPLRAHGLGVVEVADQVDGHVLLAGQPHDPVVGVLGDVRREQVGEVEDAAGVVLEGEVPDAPAAQPAVGGDHVA